MSTSQNYVHPLYILSSAVSATGPITSTYGMFHEFWHYCTLQTRHVITTVTLFGEDDVTPTATDQIMA